MTTLELLDACKARLGIESDYALAKHLRVTQQAVSSYRSSNSTINDDVCLTVAQILCLPPLEVIALANAERARTPEARAKWESLLSGFFEPQEAAPTFSKRAMFTRERDLFTAAGVRS